MAAANAKRKRQLGDELPSGDQKKGSLSTKLSQQITRQGAERLLTLVDSEYADAIIRCQGREIRACVAILASRSKFFDACFRDGNFKEAHTKVVAMDDDDPDALEAFIIYLHTASIAHIENWKISYYTDDEGDDYFGGLPEGHLPFLVEVYRLADKYDEPLLAESVSVLLDTSGGSANRMGELHDYYENYPVDALRAVALLRDMPDSTIKVKMEESLRHEIQRRSLAVPRARYIGEPKVARFEKQIQEQFSTHPSIATDLLFELNEEVRRLRAALTRPKSSSWPRQGEVLTV